MPNTIGKQFSRRSSKKRSCVLVFSAKTPSRPREKVTDPQVLADVGPVPDHETLIEIPEDVLAMYARRYLEGQR